MARSIEIGGNFPLEDVSITCDAVANSFLQGKTFTRQHLTFSGRTAISLLISNIDCAKEVLLPDHTCDTCIRPFAEAGFNLHFYRIDKQGLEPNFDIFANSVTRMAQSKGGIVFIEDYYGFNTNAKVKEFLKQNAFANVTVIEDITHSWFSDFTLSSAQYYIASFRKWLGIPDGGIAASREGFPLNAELNPECTEEVLEYKKASEEKKLYLSNGNESLKESFFPLFRHVNTYFSSVKDVKKISETSLNILERIDINSIKTQRRLNANFLIKNIKNQYIDFVFDKLPPDATPLYVPIFVKGIDRSELQSHLAKFKIYCPFHWPTSPFLQGLLPDDSFQNNILSLVCDQRYTLEDMDFFVSVLNDFHP